LPPCPEPKLEALDDVPGLKDPAADDDPVTPAVPVVPAPVVPVVPVGGTLVTDVVSS
jgi:hypothetical protein